MRDQAQPYAGAPDHVKQLPRGAGEIRCIKVPPVLRDPAADQAIDLNSRDRDGAVARGHTQEIAGVPTATTEADRNSVVLRDYILEREAVT